MTPRECIDTYIRIDKSSVSNECTKNGCKVNNSSPISTVMNESASKSQDKGIHEHNYCSMNVVLIKYEIKLWLPESNGENILKCALISEFFYRIFTPDNIFPFS